MNDHNPVKAAVREALIQSGARHHDFSPEASGMPRIETKSPLRAGFVPLGSR